MQNIEIRIKGRIDEHWSSWFADLEIRYTQQGETVLSGPVADQATLYGVLNRLRDLGLPLLSVICVEPDDEEAQ
jgi:hypothetical protein